LLGLEEKYAYAVGRTRAVEARLLDRATIERMIDASDVHGALKVLEEAGYAHVDSPEKGLLPIDEILEQEESKLARFIKETSPDERLAAFIALRHDYHNLKVMLKAKIYHVSPAIAMSGLGSLSTEAISKALDHETRELPNQFVVAIEKAEAVHSLRPSPEVIDIVIDRVMHEALLDLAQTIGIPFLTEQVQREIDFLNLSIFLRAKKMKRDRGLVEHAFVAGGNIDPVRLSHAYEDESGDALMDVLSGTGYEFIAGRGLKLVEEGESLSEIEGFFEEAVSRSIRQARYVPLGPEPLIGYILAKKQELRIARLVIAGKAAGVSRDSMRERLRDAYV
jgi:V/A-type H+-transporting ATPase subunit C